MFRCVFVCAHVCVVCVDLVVFSCVSRALCFSFFVCYVRVRLCRVRVWIYVCQMYGFEGEVTAKYDKDMMRLFTDIFQVSLLPYISFVGIRFSLVMMRLFTDIFQWLPLAHVIGGKVLVVHGGLFSKEETCLDDLRKINRHQVSRALSCVRFLSRQNPRRR